MHTISPFRPLQRQNMASVTRSEHYFRLEHLRAWFTPERRLLISARAVDQLAGSPTLVAFQRFLAGNRHVTFRHSGLNLYYTVLAHVGYVPPTSDEVAEGIKKVKEGIEI